MRSSSSVPPSWPRCPGTIAGGLILAAAADERYAAQGDGRFGLSGVALGVPVPGCCLEVSHHAIGSRETERLAASGENLTVEAALAIGLIDRALPSGEVLEQAIARARFLSELPGAAYAAIKRRARRAALARFDEARREDPFLDFWFCEEAQTRIRSLVSRLKKRD